MDDREGVRQRHRQIGEIVQALRGSRSQQEIANAMRERGHEWSQSTMWSVESGKRPLRLTEAADLATILNVDIPDLVPDPPDLPLIRKEREVLEQMQQLRVEWVWVLEKHRQLVQAALELRSGGGEVPNRILELVKMGPDDLLREVTAVPELGDPRELLARLREELEPAEAPEEESADG